jgi:Periplasmic component of the Tol biopolymer transport system
VTKNQFAYWYIFFILIVCGCSIEINQPTESAPPSAVETAPATSPVSIIPVTHVPITWVDLTLSGKLIYLTSSMENNASITSIQLLDLVTGDISIIFSAPPGAWIYYATISPDAKQMIMSYQPAPGANSASNRTLYSMPLDVPAPPQPFLTPPTADDHYTQVEWSPDGRYVYFVHYNHKTQEQGQFYETYEIFRMAYPNGEPEKILDRAFWPRLSADSSKLVYVSLDPVSGLNELFTANADGSNPQKINFSGSWIPDIIDAPLFSPDGHSILFSTPGPGQSYQPNWVEKLMGIQVAKAHSIPSDWWSVPVSGGTPTRLTNIQTINLFASLLPDHQHIASVSGDGLFVMNLDGSNLTQLISDSGVHGTVSWLP